VSGGVGNHRAVFLDRDGTVIREVGHLHRRDQVEILARVPEAIRVLRARGFCVVVVTNQSAVARGLLTEEELGMIHEELKARLAQQGAQLDGIYYCPHHPTEGKGTYQCNCDCRKPNTGMIVKAAADLGLDTSRSYVVGDQASDMVLADRVGAKGVLIAGPGIEAGAAGSQYPVVADLWQAAGWILGERGQFPER
jgi:D-glycero-D-manno-heptose 1,7-bisphosphate phosphatase